MEKGKVNPELLELVKLLVSDLISMKKVIIENQEVNKMILQELKRLKDG